MMIGPALGPDSLRAALYGIAAGYLEGWAERIGVP